MRYCIKCIMPDTRPGIVIDTDGICSGCKKNIFSSDNIDWKQKKLEFNNLIKETYHHQNNNGNLAIVPVSGGKDSTMQLVKALDLKLNPLAVTWRSPGRTNHGQKNLDNIAKLGVTHFDITINPKVEKTLIKKCFMKSGNPSIAMHLAIHSIPLIVAEKADIPLVLWAENPALTIGSSHLNTDGGIKNNTWFKYFGGSMNTTYLDWIDSDLTKENLYLYSYAGKEIKNIKEIFLGYFFKWNPHEIASKAEKYGKEKLKKPLVGIHNFAEDDDDMIMPISEWIKWHKFGLTRSWDNLSIDIRLGKVSREDALEKIKLIGYEKPENAINKFCDYLEIKSETFHSICDSFRNKKIWTIRNGFWEMDQFLIKNWEWKEKAVSQN